MPSSAQESHFARIADKTGMTSEQFFPLIGKMTLIHAGIEHDIKGVLSEDWKISPDKVEGLYGFKLRQFFL